MIWESSLSTEPNNDGSVRERYSYGPQNSDMLNPGKLVSLTDTGTDTDIDDKRSWDEGGKGVVVVNLTYQGFKDDDIIASGENVNAQLGTQSDPGQTNYAAVPNGLSGNANSNSGAGAVVEGGKPGTKIEDIRPSGVVAVGDGATGSVGTAPPPPCGTRLRC